LADSLLALPSLDPIHLFDGGPLFNRFVRIAATDLKYRQPMPKYMFVTSESFCLVPNTTVYNGSVDRSTASTHFVALTRRRLLVQAAKPFSVIAIAWSAFWTYW
jgi:hypothetical protein